MPGRIEKGHAHARKRIAENIVCWPRKADQENHAILVACAKAWLTLQIMLNGTVA
jgi:hypothetical protein